MGGLLLISYCCSNYYFHYFSLVKACNVEGGGQPVLSFEQCFILFSCFPLLLAFVVGGLGFEFCVLEACSSE